LTVPSEDAVFGKYTAGSGGKTGSGGEIASSGGSSGEHPAGGTADGGMPSVGGTSPTAGTSSGGNSAGGSAPGGGASGEGGAPIVLPPATLLLRYSFDDASNLGNDDSKNGLNAQLTGTSLPSAATGHIGGAIHFDSSKQQFAELPTEILMDMDAVSISSWLELDTAATWNRLFNFSAGEGTWFYFSPTGWNDTTKTNGTRVAVRDAATLDPEVMLTEAFPVGTWHHVAVVLAPPILRYYLDGKLKSELTTMTIAPKDLGKTNQNWIGRSVYTGDPYLNGLVDEFRIYSGALTPTEIKDLAAQ
jgi:hypothetical protein